MGASNRVSCVRFYRLRDPVDAMLTAERALEREGLNGLAGILPKAVLAELSDRRLRAHRDELIAGRQFQVIMAHLQQRRMQLANAQIAQHYIDGIGEKIMTIHPQFAAHLRLKYGSGCLHDPDFLRDTLKRNPFLRVRCLPRKVTLRVHGRRKDNDE